MANLMQKLTKDQLQSMITGRFSTLEAIFGKDKIMLDIASTPKKIVLRGSKKDLNVARQMIGGGENTQDTARSPPPSPPKAPQTCGVCWTEATDPLKMQCGHAYCRNCFLHQVQSVGEHGIPLRCCGGEGKCTHVSSTPLLPAELVLIPCSCLASGNSKNYFHSPDSKPCYSQASKSTSARTQPNTNSARPPTVHLSIASKPMNRTSRKTTPSSSAEPVSPTSARSANP
jgi:hypothetical protein